MEVLDQHTQKILSLREEFPVLTEKIRGYDLVYLDNGATCQKPASVIDSISQYYQKENSNVHRGVHYLSQLATDKMESARRKVKDFINAKHEHEVIFTTGTTGSINLVATSFERGVIKKGDEIIISALEHHSNIVPWQILCENTEAILKVVSMNDLGELKMEEFDDLLSEKTKLVAVNHVSNALGTINPIKEIISKAHDVGAKVLIDGAQAAPHMKIDVQELDCDFYAFSGHKMYGPTGIGVLYGKEQILNDMPPYQGGGEMIKEVTFEKTTYNELPFKFEAGTPNIAGIIGLGAAVDFMEKVGRAFIQEHESNLIEYTTKELLTIDELNIVGQAKDKAGVVSFNIEGLHPYDIGSILDQMGIAVRTGHHCTQPIMNYFCIPGTVRASFAVYNTKEDIDRLVEGVRKAKKMLS